MRKNKSPKGGRRAGVRALACERTLEGVESPRMKRKGQVKRLDGRNPRGRATFVAGLFAVAA